MVCKVNCAAIEGICVCQVVVETDIGNGLPSFDMVGLLSSDTRESRERVRTALKNSGFEIPPKRITINLAPGDIRKTGTYYDVAIAISILQSLGIINADLSQMVFAGELSLDGSVVGVKGILPIVLDCIERGMSVCFVPEANIVECEGIEGIKIVPVTNLNQLVKMISTGKYNDSEPVVHKNDDGNKLYDFADIYGQSQARKAAEIAAAGMHNFLMVGEPGTGKSIIAKAMPSIMPNLTREESVEISRIHSVAGLLRDGPISTRPFRSPHHTITTAAMLGGGSNPKPGEVTLAHGGILYLDELPEFSRGVMEALRQPLEDRYVRISRTYGNFEFPTDFMLLGAMNPCRCGYYPDRNKCSCTERDVNKYIGKISGPIMDRIDLQVRVNSVSFEEINSDVKMESSQAIKERVDEAVERQRFRYRDEPFNFNSQLSSVDIKTYCHLSSKNQSLFSDIYERFGLSVRSYEKILKVARTIADLEGSDSIKEKHLMLAVSYKVMGRE